MNKWNAVPAAVLLALACAASAFAGAQQYLNPQFRELTAAHKLVAVMPLKVTIDTKRLKDVTLEAVRQNEKDEALEFQHQIYSRFLEKSGPEHYTVSFQDVDQTNALLLKAGVNLDSVAFVPKSDLAKILGVDAIVSGSVSQSQPTSQGMALAQSLLIGVHGSTQRVDIRITLHNGADSALLWSYDHTDSGGGMTGSLANSVEAMSKSLFKKVAGNFPYKTK